MVQHYLMLTSKKGMLLYIIGLEVMGLVFQLAGEEIDSISKKTGLEEALILKQECSN